MVVNGEKDFTYTKKELIKNFVHPYQRAPRTMFGQKEDGTIVWVVVDGRSKRNKGINIEQQASIMLELGCINALNLDGGGSSEMIINDEIMNSISDKRERRIGAAFLAYRKLADRQVIMTLTGVVKAKVLNVRNKPNTSGDIVSKLKKNTKVTIIGIDERTGWYKIGPSEYVSNLYVSLI